MTAVRQAEWQAKLAAGASQTMHSARDFLAEPAVFRTLQRFLLLALALWIGVSLWQALSSFIPEAEPLPAVTVLNPVTAPSQRSSAPAVDVDKLVAAQLFGEPGAVVSDSELAALVDPAPITEDEASRTLAGIEDGAPETRLPVLLRGVVASSQAGLGQAVIEHQKAQALYQVGDELPLSGEVVLAKVLVDSVVLDNGGRYEILRLFEDTGLLGSLAENDYLQAPPRAEPVPATDQSSSDVEEAQGAAEVAATYRDRLYDDPQSLADVVQVTAVRDGVDLQGYRVTPGKAAREFAALGFESGDVVTAINGLSLSDPSNTVRLYQAMRSADEANFELLRNGESVTLNVSIGQISAEQNP